MGNKSICKKEKNNINSEKKVYKIKGNKSVHLILHESNKMYDYILEMTLEKYNENAEFILICDISGSMGKYSHFLMTRIIPKALNLLNYKDNDYIHIITFDSNSLLYNIKINDLKKKKSFNGRGKSRMANSYKLVKNIIQNNTTKCNYRILVISDGELSDEDDTKKEAQILKNFIDIEGYIISTGFI